MTDPFTSLPIKTVLAASVTPAAYPNRTAAAAASFGGSPPDYLTTAGYYSAGDGGGATYIQAGGSTAGGFQSADGQWWKLAVNTLYVGMFGAKGDDVADDTGALQAAINYVVANSLSLYWGAGTYRITDALTIPQGEGWEFFGNTQIATVLEQATDNKPIFKFIADLTHSWSITDFFLTWANPQASTNTHSCALFFTGNNLGRFNFQVGRCICNNGFRFFSNDTAVSPLTWGCTIRDCTHYNTNSGGFWNTGQASSAGQPNVKLDGIQIDAAGIVAGEDIVLHNAGDTFVIDHVEILNVVNSNTLLHLTGTRAHVGVIKVEKASYTAPGSVAIFLENSRVAFDLIELLALTINVPGSFVNGVAIGSAGTAIISNYSMTFTAIAAGKFIALSSGVPPDFCCILIGPPIGLIGTSNAWLTNVPSTVSPEGVSVDAWQQPRLSADIGDANSTWTIGVDNNVIQCLTQLSDDRTVTFLDEPSGADSNLYDGIIVRVVRNASTPGAFNLTVKDNNGTTLGVLSSTNGVMEFMWQRFGWHIVAYSAWSGTTP